MPASHAKQNRLARETSPYLLQHAHNPVDWYSWGPEALAQAVALNRPILLSIGYSACHWCHVMAHESFEDVETARLMNDLFINIKVDREERPDLDKICQSAHQLLTGRGGGWPLTVFLSPHTLAPFFAGTYFPKTPRYGMPVFAEVLKGVAAYFREHPDDVAERCRALVDALRQMDEAGDRAGVSMTPAPLDSARRQLHDQYDARNGGFGPAPKFPHPGHLEVLLHHWALRRSQGAADGATLAMVTGTLDAMALGGMYDHLGGGFFRYAVDERWEIPHFEKMLYDNGPLLALYAQVWQVTGEARYREVAEQTAAWAMREMQSPDGGYYAAQDADTGGVEGACYLWTPEEARTCLAPDEYAAFSARYGLNGSANFEGRWHLHVPGSQRDRMPDAPEQALLAAARSRLFALRRQRGAPGRDEKVICAWNGLMIRGMAIAGRIFGHADWLDSAGRALDFIRARMFRDGRLRTVWKDGRAPLNAYLDDYVFLIDAIIELQQARWREGELAFALELLEAVLAHFEDGERGGFYFTSHDHEALFHRVRQMSDDATVSGNGVAAQVLLRLGHLSGEARYLEAAQRTLGSAWSALKQMPYAHGSLLLALEAWLQPGEQIVLRGSGPALEAWRDQAMREYAPRRLCLAIPAEACAPAPLLAQYPPQGEVVAYACRGAQCHAPMTDLAEFRAFLVGQ